MRYAEFITFLTLLLSPLAQAAALRDAEAVAPFQPETRDEPQNLFKRKGGGGGGGRGGGGGGTSSSGSSGRGGSSSSSSSGSGSSSGGSSSSSRGGTTGSSGSSSGSSSSGGSSSSSGGASGGSRGGLGSSSSNVGGSTRTGSGAPRTFGGGSYYGGGARAPYPAGALSPAARIAPFLLVGAAIAFWPGVWLYGAHMYPYTHPYTYYNQTAAQEQTKNVICGCDPYQPCGCDDNNDTAIIQELVGNGVNYNQTLLAVATVNGTSTLLINGTLPNGTTAPGGTEDAFDNAAPGGYRAAVEALGFWPVVATACAAVFFL